LISLSSAQPHPIIPKLFFVFITSTSYNSFSHLCSWFELQ
jgi:hypothetical protein